MKEPKSVGKEPVKEPQGMERALREMASMPNGMQLLLETWAHTPEGSEFLQKWLDTPEGSEFLQKWLGTPEGSEFLQKWLDTPEGSEFLQKWLGTPGGGDGIAKFVASPDGMAFLKTIASQVSQWSLQNLWVMLDSELWGKSAKGIRQPLQHYLLKATGHRPTARERTRQVKFECSEDFYKRLSAEKLQRNLTLQQLATRALDRYLAIPESVHRQIEEAAKKTRPAGVDVSLTGEGVESHFERIGEMDFGLSTADSNAIREALEVTEARQAVIDYLAQFPPEKVHMVRNALASDLKYYRQSRFWLRQQKRKALDARR